MGNSFIPSLHLDTAPKDKLTSEWCLRAIQYYYHQTSNHNLLEGKNVDEIEDYSSGEIKMKPFKRMYKSYKRKEAQFKSEHNINGNHLDVNDDSNSLQFNPLPLIVTPFNSATEIVQKIPIEISCTALDPLAERKRKEDLTFLKNKPQVENDLKQVTDKMGISPIDLGTTQHSSVPFSDSPYGFDLSDPDEYEVVVNLLYNLGVEVCFETILQAWYELKNIQQVKLLEVRDQFKFGVSCNSVFQSSLTGLPDMSYEYPANIETPYSELPDYSDNTHRFKRTYVTPMDLFNLFGNEICNEETLEDIVIGSSGYEKNYCSCNQISTKNLKGGNYDRLKMCLIYFEVKSVDWIGVMSNPKSKKGFKFFSADAESKTCTDKIWGQNTYGFYWLLNTDKIFGIHRLGYSYRTAGVESYQNFSTNIYRSQTKSAVENSIGENKKAQVADIKLQYAVLMARPNGVYIDLKYVRGALKALTEESSGRTIDDLIEMVIEKNIMIGDSSGFDGANEGQFKPFQEIVGGIRTDAEGYLRIIISAIQNIAAFTGINQQLTGQSQDPNALIGVEKIRINSSLNALHYANTGIETQYKKVFNQFAVCFQDAIKKGGKTKEAVTNIIGSRKVGIIERLDEIPLHRIGVDISLTLREEEQQRFDQQVYRLQSTGVLSTADIYMLDYIPNKKDKWALLAARERQFMKKQDIIRQQNYANQQQLVAQQGQNMVGQEQAATDGEIKKVYAKGDVDSKLVSLQNQLNAKSQQYNALLQKSITADKTAGQIQKALQTLQAKADLKDQEAL